MLIEQKLRELTNAPSIREVSKQIGVSVQTLYKAIEHPQMLNGSTLKKICDYLKISPVSVLSEVQTKSGERKCTK